MARKKRFPAPARSGAGKVRWWAAAVWLGVWQLAGTLLRQPLLLPVPLSVLRRLGELSVTAAFWRTACRSTARILSGFALGCLSGILLAVPAHAFRRVRELLYPAVAAVRAVPVASFIILSMLWLNARTLSVFIAFLIAFPPVYLGVLEGIGQADTRLLEMAAVFRVPLLRQIGGVYFPAALPAFRTAVSLSVGMCWKAGVAAEIIALPAGSLGERLYKAKVYFLTEDLFAWTLAVVLLSVLFERLLVRLLDRLVGWRE